MALTIILIAAAIAFIGAPLLIGRFIHAGHDGWDQGADGDRPCPTLLAPFHAAENDR